MLPTATGELLRRHQLKWGSLFRMRISEKTVELTFCSQVSRSYSGRLVWFGLTQRQEAEAGFDACTKLGGSLILFQFKASAIDVHSSALGTPCRRFHAPHHQLVALQARVKPFRQIFYAFPLIGRTDELTTKRGDFLTTTWLLNVANLPPLPPPTTNSGTLRKSEIHYVDIIPGLAAIHSEPISTTLLRASDLGEYVLTQQVDRIQGTDRTQEPFEEFWPARLRRLFYQNAVGAVVLPR